MIQDEPLMSSRASSRWIRAAVATVGLVACRPAHPTATTDAPATSAPAAPAVDVDDRASVDDATLRGWLGGGRFAIRPGDHAPVRGSTHALVRIVVFQDFTAPQAGALAQAYGAALARWPEAVQVVLVHAPARASAMALPVAELTIAAGAQGKFWQAHDQVLREPPADRQALVDAAVLVDLDVEEVRSALADGRHRAWIDADVETARAHGIARGPAAFVNGVPAPADPAALESLVERELELAERIVAAGVPRSRLQVHIAELLPAPPPAPELDGPADLAVNWAVPAGDAPMLGPKNALVTIIVFADFECPFCARVQPVLSELRTRHPDDVRVVFRHFPLTSHRHARAAAKATVAADRQGKFWRMHDFLFDLKGAPDEQAVAKAVRRLRLDKRKFARDVASAQTESAIAQDERVAREFGVNGTPEFFVNGRRVSGAQPFEAFEALVVEELAKAREFAKTDAGGAGTVYDRMILGFAVPPQ
jgi:protein-disulfide isomerase